MLYKTFSEFVFRKCCLNWLATAFLAGRLLCGQGFTDEQLVLVEQNTLMVVEREREIRQIVQSIADLSEIFRDLGAMIVEQVCVLCPFTPVGKTFKRVFLTLHVLGGLCFRVLWAFVIPCENAIFF